MSSLSQFIGGCNQVGSYITALDAPVNFTVSGQEYLRAGSVKTYDSSYAAAIVSAPQIRVFGTDAKTYGAGQVGGDLVRYYFIGSRYFSAGNAANWRYGTSLNSLGTVVVGGNTFNVNKRIAVNGTAFAVAPSAFVNTELGATSDGITMTPVGGTFTTCPIKSAIAFGNNSWISLSTLQGAAGEQTYINAASPTGTWTVGASTNIGMTAVNAMAYGSGLFVAVGNSAPTTTGKIATTPAVGSAWTDRTAGSGITFDTGENVQDMLHTGSAFLALVGSAASVRMIRSTNAINWASVTFPFDMNDTSPWGAVSWVFADAKDATKYELTSDGAGTVTLVDGSGKRATIAISTDHGVTWAMAGVYIGKSGLANTKKTMSYTNGRWIANMSGEYQTCLDIGTSLATPDLIGQQYSYAAGSFVRIK